MDGSVRGVRHECFFPRKSGHFGGMGAFSDLHDSRGECFRVANGGMEAGFEANVSVLGVGYVLTDRRHSLSDVCQRILTTEEQIERHRCRRYFSKPEDPDFRDLDYFTNS